MGKQGAGIMPGGAGGTSMLRPHALSAVGYREREEIPNVGSGGVIQS